MSPKILLAGYREKWHYPRMTTQRQKNRWAKQVRNRREAAGITQERLAGMSGYSLSYLQKIENAKEGSADSVQHFLELIDTAQKLATA